MGTVWTELRDAVRSLAANPGFTATVVAILALGIGANTTMFSVVNAVVLRPIPWENPERLVNLLEVNAKQDGYLTAASKANYKDWREQRRLLERMAAFRAMHYNLADTGAEPERVPGMSVSAEFFPLIGVKPALGRTFLLEEEQPGRDHVVLLSNGLWRRRYGADPAIVGRTITVEGELYTVAGVLPDFPMFRILNHAIDIYTPLTLPGTALTRDDHSIGVYARLRPGVTAARAQGEMDGISNRLEEITAETFSPQSTFGTMLSAAAGMALLLAATGIYALRAWSVSRRTREIGIRMAIGAAPADVARMVLRKALPPAMAGILAGAGGALALHAILRAQIACAEGFDPVAFALPAVVLALVSMAAGIAPALRAVRVDPMAALRME